MKRVFTFILLIILLTSIAQAEVIVEEKPTIIPLEEPGIFVSTIDDFIAFTARTDINNIHIFIDDNEIETYDNMKEGTTKKISTKLTNEHIIEVRYLKEHSYIWDRPTITTNDKPGELKYVEYDKDAKKVKFSITGADFVHKNQLSTTANSYNEPFTEYTVIVNSDEELNCYPRITTGNNLFFSCKSNNYANRVEIDLTLGIKEQTIVNVKGKEIIIPVIISEPEKTEKTINEIEEIINEEKELQEETTTIKPLDNIEMIDTFKKSSIPIPVTLFIILMFVTVIALLFIVAHHNYESKQAGTHHITKKTRLEKMEEENK